MGRDRPHRAAFFRDGWAEEERRVERVGVVLQSLEGQASLRRRLAEARAIDAWPEIVGAQLAARTRPLRVADGRLFVLAKGAALRQELTFHTRTIVRKFNAAARSRVVREVVFLEADALEGAGALARAATAPLADREAGTEERREAPWADETGEGAEEGEEETEPDVGAMYEPFDAEAYRRQLDSLRNATTERQEP